MEEKTKYPELPNQIPRLAKGWMLKTIISLFPSRPAANKSIISQYDT